MQLYRRETSAIGLDIGSSMIKAAKMTLRGKRYYFENYALEPVEEGVIQSGEIKNPSSLAQSALKAVRKCDPHMKEVVIALPNSSILSDVLTMDLRSEKDMREAVMVEAQQISPFDMAEVELDYAILSRDEAAKKMKVLMVVAKNDIILSYIDFLSEAGLKPTVFDVDLFALNNICHLNYDMGKYHSGILLNIGSENTVAAFYQNGTYHSSRDISIAGMNFIRELKNIPDMTSEKCYGIVQGKITQDLDLEAVTHALNSSSKELANAVDVALSYLQSSDVMEKLDVVLLSGGYAWVPGLINVLEMRTGAEVMVMDPFVNIRYNEKTMENVDLKRIGAILSVAMGLATRNN
ncbi:MAG: type IV pilus assembly protein PilM [Candidatus Latescibacter sp.]|nr:type IV pilus assembly protein PilM [Candidatus Latescibacter sp.]